MSKNSTSDRDKKLNVYENNYLLIKLAPKYDQEKMALAYMDYFFKDEADTDFKDERSNVIWMNIKLVLDKSKIQSKNASKRWGEDAKDDASHNAKSNAEVNAIYFIISNFIFLEDRGLLRGKIEEWVKYKAERKEYYKETGFKSLLTRIKNHTEEYGEDKVIDLIDECMASNYAGIIFEKLKKGQAPVGKRVEATPEWYGKDIEAKELTEAEQRAFEERLKTLR